MKYIEICIKTSTMGTDLLAAELMNIGILNVMIDDPIIDMEMMQNTGETEYVDASEFDLEREPSITVYLEYNEESIAKTSEIKALVANFREEVKSGIYGEDFDAGSLELTSLARTDDEWKDNWKAYFKPTKISSRVVIRPSWEEYESEAGSDEIVVAINPGMAFGTGTHETTSLSVKALEKYLKPSDRVLDVGCGTGILAIIASKLGAHDALGIDIDQDAVDASNENIELNDCGDNVSVRLGDLTVGVDYAADVVVANLLTPLVIRFSGDVSRHLETGGLFISSGILCDHEERVQAALEENGFRVLEIMEDGDWCSFTAEKM